jgi:Rrf2 family transcriptional regulator, cysteine metabolism repressor
VKLSVRSDYAVRALLSLARHFPNEEPRRVEELAAEHGVSRNFLAQVLIELKSQHIVRSVRGNHGGYVLARPPAQITLGDVMRCIHGQVFDTPALSDGNCPPELRNAWERIKTSINAAADGITFQQLADESAAKDKMYYI